MNSALRLLATVTAVLGTALCSPAMARQEASTPEQGPAAKTRPKVVLVLSGGGARGSAHVGVIRRLEELRVPVDMVVGTSMGSIVGGFYAAGYNAEEMSVVLDEADWLRILSDKAPREKLWFRRREDDRRFQVDLEMGWTERGLTLPPGFIQGSNVEGFLEQQLFPVSRVSDFDQLPIPFRCVATDAVTGEAYVFEDGKITTAVRASLAIPGMFSAVHHDGRVLVDGGVVDNLPVALAQELGADVVIAIDIGGFLGDEESLATATGNFGQMIALLTLSGREASLQALREQDIYLKPDVSDIGQMDFASSLETVEIGYDASASIVEQLRALSVSEEEYAAWRSEVRARRTPPPVPRVVIIEGDSGLSPEVLERVSTLEVGVPLTPDKLAETRDRFTALGIFDHVDIDLLPPASRDGVGDTDVLVRPHEKSWGPHYLRFGIGISTDMEGQGEFELGVQHTSTPLNSWGGEWRNEAQIGTRGRFLSEFYQPLDAGLRWFVVPFATYEYDTVPVYVAGTPVADFNSDAFQAGLGFGRNLGDWGEFRVNMGQGRILAEPRIIPPGLPRDRIDVDQQEIEVLLILDTMNRTVLPEHGVFAELRYRVHDQSVDFELDNTKSAVSGAFSTPLTLGPFTALGLIEGGTTIAGDPTVGNEFYLGGFRRLSGVAPNSLYGEHYALAVLQFYVRLGERTTTFGVAPFVGATVEAGNVWLTRDEISAGDLLYSASVYVGADTLLGQCYLGAGIAEGGDTALYVFIGPVL